MEVIPVKNAFTSEIIHITKEKKYIKAIINDTNLVFYTKYKEYNGKINNSSTSNGVAKVTREINFSNNFEIMAIIKCFFLSFPLNSLNFHVV